MSKLLLVLGAVVVVAVGAFLVLYPKLPANKNNTNVHLQADGSVIWNGKHYYKVLSTDLNPEKDTGNEVCASVGKKCVGYTDESLDVCLIYHPTAGRASDWDGAKVGFYCDGPPQQGVCARELSTCHICPQCGINMDCDMHIGTLYRETYVECE